MWRSWACQTLCKALDISGAIAQVAQNMLKALAILSDATFRKSAVNQEDLNYSWNQKSSHMSLDDQQFYYLEVFQRLF